jgi:putative membrane protein
MFVRSPISYFAAVVILCGAALAQPPAGAPGQTTSPPTGPPEVNRPNYPGGAGPLGTDPGAAPVMSDKAFVKKAAEQTATEVELAKLAQEKGSSDGVKEFSKRVVEDQSKINPDLAAAASKVSVEVPSELPRGGKKAREKLAKLSGPDFDRAYAKLMLNDQKDNVQTFTQEARLGTVPEVREFAAKTLPTLQQHQKMAEVLESSVKK